MLSHSGHNSKAIPENVAGRSKQRFAGSRSIMSRIDTFAAWLLFSVLLTAALGFMLFAADLLSTRGLVVFLSLVIAEIAVASLIYSQARGDRFDIFEPSIVANLMFLLYYCVRPIYLMYNLDVENGIARGR